jgi:uncharacterized MAPEG superfamily protein
MMEVLRVRLVLVKAIAANQFRPDNANLSPFMQRLARAQANCVEGLPVFGGLLVVAVLADATAVTDPLAYLFLVARIIQSGVHLVSLSVLAVNIRFFAFVVQMAIGAYWTYRLLSIVME